MFFWHFYSIIIAQGHIGISRKTEICLDKPLSKEEYLHRLILSVELIKTLDKQITNYLYLDQDLNITYNNKRSFQPVDSYKESTIDVSSLGNNPLNLDLT